MDKFDTAALMAVVAVAVFLAARGGFFRRIGLTAPTASSRRSISAPTSGTQRPNPRERSGLPANDTVDAGTGAIDIIESSGGIGGFVDDLETVGSDIGSAAGDVGDFISGIF